MYQNLRKVQFAYEQNEVMNLSPVQITEHLYKALGKCLRSAREGLLEGNPARKGENIGRAISILGELRASLDLEGGEEIAANLNALYAYLTSELTMANLRNDQKRLHDAIKTVDPLIEAWSQLAEQEGGKVKFGINQDVQDQPMAVHATF